MYRSKRLLAAVVSVALFGLACGQPKIDGSSAESLKSSVNKVRGSLPRENRADFDLAMAVIFIKDRGLKVDYDLVNKLAIDYQQELLQRGMGEDRDGMAAEEVFAEAVRILEERKTEVEEYHAKKQRQEQRQEQEVRDFLSQFKVLEWKLWDKEYSFGISARELTLKVRNETAYAVAHVGYKVTIKSPDRAVPWADEDGVTDVIRGGIEPGEELTCRLTNVQIGGLLYAEYPRDAEVKVEVISLSGPEFESEF